MINYEIWKRENISLKIFDAALKTIPENSIRSKKNRWVDKEVVYLQRKNMQP